MSRARWPGLLLAMFLATAALVAWQVHHRRAAAAWLQLARQTPASLDYYGDLEVAIDGGPTELRSRVAVDHLAPQHTRYQYLGPDLAGVQLLIDGDRAVRTDPQTGQQTIRAADMLGVPMNLAGYRARVSRGPYVAGRPTVLVRLVRARMVRELWLDKRHGLPLRTRTIQPQGMNTDTRFVRVVFQPPPEPIAGGTPHETARTSGPLSVAELSRRVGFTVHEPRFVPSGFRLVETRQCACACGCEGGTAQLLYSDGVGHLSLFYTGADCQQCFASAAACAACVTHQRAMRLERSAVQVVGRADAQVLVVAIGDASEGELARMAGSVPPSP